MSHLRAKARSSTPRNTNRWPLRLPSGPLVLLLQIVIGVFELGECVVRSTDGLASPYSAKPE
ncbi:hypothetical protein [Bradyrhizobium sp.]|uniref:hypothetical protein n=1 Tax=Bradyrhizobium sp. TaxID=376 RepID=UPI00260372EF|nr:hypothetical protein [Bradyrhizobium sp.]